MPPVVLVRFVSARIFVGDSLKLRFPNSGDEEMAVVASEVVEYDSDRLGVRIDPQLEVARAVCWSTICAGDVIVIMHSRVFAVDIKLTFTSPAVAGSVKCHFFFGCHTHRSDVRQVSLDKFLLSRQLFEELIYTV